MKKRMLLGATGLALAGVGVASVFAGGPRSNVPAFLEMRNAALGEAGSNARAEVLAQLRDAIAAGTIDPKTVVFVLNEDLIPGFGNAPLDITASGSGTEAGGPAPVFLADPFATPFYTLTSYVSTSSQVGLGGQSNPAGRVIQAAPLIGAATDAIITNPANAVVGFAPAAAPPGGEPYAALARRTGQDGLRTAFNLGMNYRHDLLSASGSSANPAFDHARISTDWYLVGAAAANAPVAAGDPQTLQAWSPVSFTEGFVADRVFFGGTLEGGVLGFAEIGGVIKNFVSLGVLAGNFTIGQFYKSGMPNSIYPFPTEKWFSLMYILVQTPGGGGFGQGLFFKDDDTTMGVGGAGPTAMDPRMANGDIIPLDKVPAGWVNLYPGVLDDDVNFDGVVDAADTALGAPTANVEGFGRAETAFLEQGPITGALNLSPLFAAITLSGTQFFLGADPPATVLANFAPDDAFFDNYVFAGAATSVPCPLPDFILPYTEDFELYQSDKPIRFQTDRIFDSISSNASSATFAAITGSLSLLNQNLNSDNLFRQEDNTAVPTFPLQLRATATVPVIITANVTITSAAGSPRTSRGLLVNDPESGSPAAWIVLGGRDPVTGFLHGVYVRQPDPTFDRNADSDANLVQGDYIDESLWGNPPSSGTPSGAPFNLEFRNVSTTTTAGDGVVVPGNTPISLEVQLFKNATDDPLNPNDNARMRVKINGVEVFPKGVDPSAGATPQWFAGGTTVSTVQMWSGNNIDGASELAIFDDINLSGPTFALGTGGDQPFSLPFTETFETYDRDVTLDSAGTTTFRNLASTPDQPANDRSRQLTLLTHGQLPVGAGTMVCRYTVLTSPAPPAQPSLCVDVVGSGLEVGSTYAINFEDLKPVFNNFVEVNNDCPGSGPTSPNINGPGQPANSTDVVTRSAENAARVEEGTWELQNLDNDPVAFDPVTMASDVINAFSYSQTTSSRWTVLGTDIGGVIAVDPTGAPLNAVTAGNDVLRVDVLADVDGTLSDNIIFGQIASILPDAFSGGSFPDTNFKDAVLQWRQFIESRSAVSAGNPNGLPIAAAPRSRMEVAVFGATADGGRITFINFGGPFVNDRALLQDPAVIPSIPVIADTNISYAVQGPLTVDPDFHYIDTGVSVLPMENKWVTCRVTVHQDSTWDLDIDSGAGFTPIVISDPVLGPFAIDKGKPGQGIGVANTSGVGSFNVNIGNDFGSGGSPVPTAIRIHTWLNGDSAKAVPGNWDDRGPTNATLDTANFNKQDDYCFYETTVIDSEPTVIADQATILQVNPLPPFTGVPATDAVPLTQSNDTIAVINRAFDPVALTVSGALIHDPCPFNVSVPKNQFELFRGTIVSGTPFSQFLGRWNKDGQEGSAGVNNPNPPGSVSRPDGPFSNGGTDTTINSYNDPTLAPMGFPGGNIARPMILAGWGNGVGVDLDGGSGVAGVDPFPVRFPPQRYFFDDVSITEAPLGPTCFGDVTGDGVVDGTDIASILNDFGNGALPAGNGNPIGNAANDINGDGVVNGADLSIVLNQFGPCP